MYIPISLLKKNILITVFQNDCFPLRSSVFSFHALENIQTAQGGEEKRGDLKAGTRQTRRPDGWHHGAERRAGKVHSCSAVHTVVRSGLLKHPQLSLEQAVAIATVM